MDLQATLMKRLKDAEPEMIAIRRHLHQYPEISFHEKNTSAYIRKFYQDLDCEVKACGEGYGLIIDIDSDQPGPKIALRADFDALAIQENSQLPFKSKNPGVMHACGHDAHTAYLMVLARELIALKKYWHGTLRILHQPAEEVAPGGALSMIQDGCLQDVDQVIGLHVMSSIKTGTIGYHAGPTQTGRSNFTLTLTGTAGHASMPQLANDAIVAASYFVTQLQTIVSRRLNPFDTGSVTIGSFNGAGSYNAIQGAVTLKGDVRVMQEATRKLIRQQIIQLVKGLEVTFGVKAKLDYDDNYPVLVNNPDLTAKVVTALKDAQLGTVQQIVDCGPQDPSEDFAYYAQKVPGCFFYIGCMANDGKNHPHHSPDFYLNEDAILIAAQAAGSVVTHFLQNNSSTV